MTLFPFAVRLRYRVKDGLISWHYEIARADAALQDALREAAEAARDGSGLPLFYGTPEA